MDLSSNPHLAPVALLIAVAVATIILFKLLEAFVDWQLRCRRRREAMAELSQWAASCMAASAAAIAASRDGRLQLASAYRRAARRSAEQAMHVAQAAVQ